MTETSLAATTAANKAASVFAEDQAPQPLDLLLVLAKHRWKIVLLPLLAAVLTYIFCMLLPSQYVARVRLLPPNLFNTALRPSSDESLANRVAEQFSIRNQGEIFTSLMRSTAVLDAVLARSKPGVALSSGEKDRARNQLSAATTLNNAKDGAIDLAVTDPSAAQAAELANGYVSALEARIRSLAVEDSTKRRDLQQQRLNLLAAELAKAEAEFIKVQERTGVVNPGNQSYHFFNYLGDLRQKLAFKETQLAAMRAYATEQHPAVLRLQTDIAATRAQVQALERTKPTDSQNKIATGQVPADEIEYVRAQRVVKALEEQLGALNKQHAQAAIETSSAQYVVQVIEPATVPQNPVWPRKLSLALLALVISFIAVLCYVVFLEYWRYVSTRQDNKTRLARLGSLLRRRSPQV